MRGQSLVVLFWVLGGLATVVIALRVFAKARIGHLRVDDMVMIFAWTLAITASSLFTAAVHYGYGQDVGELLSENSVLAVKYYIITQACVIGSTAAARVAFIIYLLAILGGEKKHGIILLALATLEVIVNAVSIILIFTSCKNVRAIWNNAINSECGPPDRQIRYGYFQSAFNTAVDLYLVAVPTWIFWRLNLRLRIRVSLVVLIGLGLLGTVASLFKIVALKEIGNTNITGATASLIRWGLIESYIVIITASLPCLRSLVVSTIHYMTTSFHARFTNRNSRPQGNQMTSWWSNSATRSQGPDSESSDNIFTSYPPADKDRNSGVSKLSDIERDL